MVLELDHVSKTYWTASGTVWAAKDVSLELYRNEVVALYGESGAGKTTLLKIAAGLLVADSGHVRVRGQDIGEISDFELTRLRNQELGFVLRDPGLSSELNVVKNVALPLVFGGSSQRGAKQWTGKVLATVGLKGKEKLWPSQLTACERKLALIARALVIKPSVLLVDEPTLDLDPAERAQVLKVLDSAAKEEGVAVVFATQDGQILAAADRVVSMHKGEVRESPPQSELAPVLQFPSSRSGAAQQ